LGVAAQAGGAPARQAAKIRAVFTMVARIIDPF
jgi:hypothetical protein